MAYFQSPVVTFEVPDDWVDQTAVVFAERVAKGVPATISLVRNAFVAGRSLDERAREMIRKMKAQLAGFELIEENEVALAPDVPAMQLLVRVEHPAGQILQLLTIFLREGTFWIFAASAPAERIDTLDAVIQQVVGSLSVGKRI